MESGGVRFREDRERATYATIGASGRSALRDEELRLPPGLVARCREAAEGAPVFYSLQQMVAWAAPLQGKRVLEICCHTAEYGALLALLGAHVDAVDIVETLIARARRRAEVNGLSERLQPQVMSVHQLAYEDASFDVVFGKAALHHLDLPVAAQEIRRVLKPGGLGIFAEPVAFSPMLRRLRHLAPVPVDSESPDERQLDRADIEEFCRPFSTAKFAYFRLLSRLERVLPGAAHALARVDSVLLDKAPSLRQWAGICVVAVTR